jgi:putative ABC transport system ATP-binding protein
MINFVNVSKSYNSGPRRIHALKDVSMSINTGEFVILWGKSGSGKSTLLNLISGIDHADSGTISVDDVKITEMNDDQVTRFRRRHVGFVYQFLNLISTLSVGENVMLPLDIEKHPPRDRRKRAKELLEEVGLADRFNDYPDRLSGGEQQRVALARALINNPSVILADEPTGNLDSETGKKVLTLLNRLGRQYKKTIIMVTHNTEDFTLGDRIYHLQDGQLCNGANGK